MADLFDEFSLGGQASSSGAPDLLDEFEIGGGSQKPEQNTSLLGDLGTDLKRGVQKLPGVVTGLADVVAGAVTGQRFADDAADSIGEATGFQPSKWSEEARDEYSPARQAGTAEIDQAWEDGGAANIAGAYARNPGSIAGLVTESLPQMLAGGIAGRGVLAAGRATGAIAAPATAAQAAGQAVAGGAIGEGAVIAGGTMDQIDREVDPRRAAAAAAGAGVVGGALSGFGARLAQRAGLIDVESALAGGVGQVAGEAPGLARRVAGGALTEGVLEELPQSIQEQMLQNWAEKKPLMEGVPRAAVEGTLAGSAIGGAVNVVRRPSEQMGLDPTAGPLSAAAATAVDGEGYATPMRDAARSAMMDGAPQPGEGSGYQPLNQQEALAQELFPTDVDADGTLRYFRYDRNLQSMIEVPAADALAAAQQQLDTWERQGFDPQDERGLDELVPQVDAESTPGETSGMASDDLTPYERNRLREMGVPDEDMWSMTTAQARQRLFPRPAEQQAEAVAEQPPLPTVESDTGPMAAEGVQATPVAGDPDFEIRVQKNGRPFRGERDVRLLGLFNQLQRDGESPIIVPHEGGWAVAVPRAPVEPPAPLGLPAPSTVLVDSQGNARRGATAPFVEPGAQVRPIGGPGMERQAPAPSRQVTDLSRDRSRDTNTYARDMQGGDLGGGWVGFSQQSGSLGIPRADMPQIRADHRGAMVNFMTARGVTHEEQTVPARSLRPTQAEFSPERVGRAAAREGTERSILVSGDGYVLDGHHQWLAKREAGGDVKVIRLNAPMAELLPLARDFPSSTVDQASQNAAAPAGGRQIAQPVQQQQARDRRRIVNRDRDSVVQAAIRLGGITTQWRQDTTGDARGNKGIPGVGALWSDKTGTSLDDMASLLDQHGYVPAGEMARDGGVTWLQAALRDELGGMQTHYAPGSLRQEADLIKREAERFGFTDDADWQSTVDRLDAAFDLTETEAELEGRRVAYEERIAELDRLFGDDDGQGRQEERADTAGRGIDQSPGIEESGTARGARSAGERDSAQGSGTDSPRDSFALEQQTEQSLSEQAAQQQAAEQAEALAQRQAEQRVQADRDRSDFTLTGSDRPSDVGAARGQNDMFAPRTRGDVTAADGDGSSVLPEILSMPRRRYIDQQAKAAGIKKGSPGYDQAIQRLQDQYEADVDRASAGITFEQYNELNNDSPEGVNRQAWEALRREFGQSYSRNSYRASPGIGKGARAGQLRMAIKQMASNWQNAPDVKVVQSIKDLPARQRRQVERDGAFDVEGIFADGQVYLVADNLTGARHAAFVLQHEVLGHAGMQGAYGNRLTPLLMSIYNGNADLKSQADALVRRFGYTPAVATEEVLADMAGAGRIAQQPFWQRLVTAMRNTLRSIGMGLNWTEGDIQGLLANARRYIERGKGRGRGRTVFSRNGDSGRLVEMVDEQGRLLAPNGKPSKLNQKQWHQTRGDNFKRWFGDWQAFTAQERLDEMAPLKLSTPEDWIGLTERERLAKVEASLKSMARQSEALPHVDLGNVTMAMSGAKKAASSAADPAKKAVLNRLQQAFEHSIYASSTLSTQSGQTAAYHKLLAPIDIDGIPLVAVFTVREDVNGRMFYNTVTVDRKENALAVSPGDVSKAQGSLPANTKALDSFVRRPLARVNPEDVSKVTGGNGEPLIVYHGTTGDFDAFARETIGSNIVLPLDAPRGFYFAKDQDLAGRYAAGDGANVMPVFVSIKNPAPSFDQYNADNTYDGFINSKIVVARNPEQVKSAIANVGTFDPSDSDIRYSRASQRDTEALRKLGLAKMDAQGLLDQVRGMTLGSLQTRMREWSVRSEEGVFDGLAGIRRAEEAAGVTDVNQQGYVSARMASGIADVMHGVLHYAAPEWRDGVVSGKSGTRGVLEILGDLGADNLTPWLAWLGGKRAQLLAAQGRENNLTDAEIAELVAIGQGKEELFEKVYREYAQVNEAVLDLAEGAGLIDKDARAAWLTEYYVPFYRQDESEGIFTAPRSKRGLSHQTAAIKALKGGDLPTNDLLANMLAGWTKRIDASMKNKALLEVVGNLQDSEFLTDESPRWQQVLISRDQIAQQIRKDRKALALAADLLDLPAGTNPIKVVNQLMKPENEGFEKLWTRVAPTDPDIIRVQRDGKSEYYRVNDESLLRGLKFMEGSVFNDPITRIGRTFKRILTTGVTASPDFILRNFIRDAAHAWVINKDGFTLGKDSIKGMRDALREDADYRDLMFAGGSFQGGYVHGADPEASAQIIRRALEKKGFTRTQQDAYLGSLVNTPAKAAAMIGKGWQRYRELGDKVENANRLSTYKAAIAAGKSRRQASYEAKDLMDYSLRGNFAAAQWFTDVVPFLNARLQGLYKLGRAVKGDKTLLAKEVAMKGGYIALFSLMLAGLNDDDERYQALQDWDKDMHWHIFLGDEHFRIPKPFELGLVFGTVPERILHALTGTQDGGDLAKAVSRGVFETLAFNPVPQFYQPIRELQANRNFFRDSPIEDMSDEGKLPEARYDERTSAIGRALGQVTGPVAGLSPKQVDHLIAAYTGTLGQYVLDMSSLLTGAFDDADRPASRSGDIPILKVIYQGDSPRSTRYQAEFYDMMREADQLNRTIKSYREEGRVEAADQLLAANREKIRHRPALGLARKQLGNVRSQMDAVYRDTSMTPEQKRQRLDALQVRSNEIAERVVKLAGGDF